MTSSGTDEIRLIEAQAAPTRFARGWHCLGLIRDFGDGKPHAINAFGQKLVVFRSGDGTINVLDSYCRHMGGDLSQGKVKGNEIACPFHDWRWGGDGRCKQVPYARRTPGWPAPRPGRPWSRTACCSSGTTPKAIRHRRRSRSRASRVPPATTGPTGTGTPLSCKAIAARSSTTSWIWRTSSTSTARYRRTSRTSSKGTWRRST